MNDLNNKLAEALQWILSVPDCKITSPQREKAREALRLYDAAQAQQADTTAHAVPEPVTVEMLKAGAAEWLKYGEHEAKYPLAQGFDSPGKCPWQRIEHSRATHVYRAMRAAALAATKATPAQAQQAEPGPVDLRGLAERAGISMDCWDVGAASMAYSEGCQGITRAHLEKFAGMVGFECWNRALVANPPHMRGMIDRALATKATPAPAPEATRSDGMPTRADERHLRRLLAARVGMPHTYFDDGEAQGAQHGISIDFMREPVADIDAKLRALNVARYEVAKATPAQAQQAEPLRASRVLDICDQLTMQAYQVRAVEAVCADAWGVKLAGQEKEASK